MVMRRIRAMLIDIDGVLTVSWKPLPGAVAAPRRLRAAAVPLALVTNTTSRTRAWIARTLAEAGFPVSASDILTAPVIAAAYLQDRYPGARCLLLNSGEIGQDLAGLALARPGDQAPADVVLVGGAGPEFSYQALNQAFGHLQRGAKLVAMHRGLCWRTSEGLQRPASTSRARTTPPPAPPTMSWIPSPTCLHCWSNCRETTRRSDGHRQHGTAGAWRTPVTR